MDLPNYPIEPSPDVWRDVLDLIRYLRSENWQAVHDTLIRYDANPDLSQQIYAGAVMAASQLTRLLAEATGKSDEAILDDLRRMFPGEG